MNDYDVVIVGGRVAGASTALLLARAGLRVAVLERSRLGADTVSTHALMRAGVLQLSRWGVLPDLVAAGTPAIRRTAFHYADGEERRASPCARRPGVDALYAPRRHLLDRVLVDAATASGADVLHETPVVGLLRDDDGRVLGVRVPGADGRERLDPGRTHRRRRRSRLPRRARGRGAVPDAGASAASAILYRYVDQVPSTGYVWAYGAGAAAGLIPTNAGETCVFVSHHAGADANGSGARAPRLPSTACSTRSRPPLADAVRAGGAAGRLHGWRGVPGHVRRSSGPGWALVGDAGYFKDPITTHGITDALRDAELLSDAVLRGSRRRVTGCRAGQLRGHPRPTVEGVVRGDGVRLPLRLGRGTDPGAAATGELGDERRGGPPVRSSDRGSTLCEHGRAYLRRRAQRW